MTTAAIDYPFPHEYIHGKYRELYCLSEVDEDQVMQNVLELLHAYQVDAAAIDAGGKRARARLIRAANDRSIDMERIKRVVKAVTPDIPAGWADIEATLAPDGRALFIEVKRPRWLNACGGVMMPEGKPSKEQLEWLRAKHERGALVMVAWSAEDVEAYLRSELHRNRKALLERKNPIRLDVSGPGRSEAR